MQLKIGEFARIGQVSIVTLRYYDQYGLLKPSALDPETGYRYYRLDQLPRLNRILTLKDLGFPLEEIALLLEHDLSLEQLRTLFVRKQDYVQQVIQTEQARLNRIAARLRQIEQEETMPDYDILLKQVPPLLVASIRERIPASSEYGILDQQLLAYLQEKGIQISGPKLFLWHSAHRWNEERMEIDAEVAVPLAHRIAGNEQINIHYLPASLVASTVHIGNDLSIGRAYMSLRRWIEANHYQLSGPVRQIRLQSPEAADTGKPITEMQFPVSLQAS
ncbi:MerR family transcriptional regulator [Dictyobacter alpinus]|uniref:MerR family transcriptional regulator n=1 Tax=Dictyobacter alpinus TaxID=2014873 RepID=A0A402BJ50_9CHLR|nr:GyrI-like domain-containing protein [Dictyobacter alpinus]GCE31385.1 MerR family transcriptional regulator [Dictyobacter alpinus]